MGRVDSKLKRYDQAIADFHKQQENVCDDYDTEFALADAYRARGMTSEAQEALQKAEKLKSSK